MRDLELIADLLREQHGTEVTAQDLWEIQYFLWEKSQSKQRLCSAGDPFYQKVDINIYADIGKALLVVTGAVLGALFLPALGIASSWVAGALIGASIGYKLTQLFDAPTSSSIGSAPVRPSSASPTYGFSSAGQLVTLGSNIPKIYGNRTINLAGGIFLKDPPKIYTRAYASKGVRYFQSLGVLAFGKLGSINQSGLKLDGKPLSDWEVGDVVTHVSSSYHNQSPPPGIANYSQAVSISTNAFVGIGKAVAVGSTRTDRVAGIMQGSANMIVSGNQIRKNSGNGWNAGARAQTLTLPPGYGSYVVVEATITSAISGAAVHSAIGLSTNIPRTDPYLMDISIVCISGPNPEWLLWNGGELVASGTNVGTTSINVGLRYYNSAPVKAVEFYLGGQYLGRYVVDIGAAVFPNFAIYNADDRITGIQVGAVSFGSGPLSPGFGTKFQVTAEALARFKPSQFYVSDRGAEMILVSKDATNNVIEFGQPIWIGGLGSLSSDTSVPQILEGGSIFAGYRSAITTSKAVTDLEILLQASIFARDSSGNLVAHGQAFNITLKNSAGTAIPIHDFIIVSAIETVLTYTIAINGLTRDIYTICTTPIAAANLAATPIRLAPDQSASTFASKTTGITVSAEIGAAVSLDDAKKYLSFDIITTIPGLLGPARDVLGNLVTRAEPKVQISGDRGPEIQITHINEIVTPSITPNYPGYAIETMTLLASDRLQSIPSESWDIPLGSIIPNYLAVSTAVGSSDNQSINITDLIAPNILYAGVLVRVLGKGTRVVTSTVSGITCAEVAISAATTANKPELKVSQTDYAKVYQWMPVSGSNIPSDAFVIDKYISGGDRILLIGDEWGRRRVATSTTTTTMTLNSGIQLVGGEEVVFYRMASSNYFPDVYVDRLINPIDGLGNYVDRDHFIDYQSIVYSRAFCARNNYFFDAVVADGSFEQWALSVAPSSLLFCTTIQGKYALIPQEGRDPNPFLFNDSNVIKYSEPGVPWQTQLTNVMLVKYQDNLGRELQVKIATSDAASGLDNEVTQSINAQGVTSKAQAIKVGQTALKSVRLQGRVCQIETDVASGLYTRQGKIIRTQHTAIEHDNQRSGFVMTAQTMDNERLVTIRSVGITSFFSGYLVTGEQHYLNHDGLVISDSIEVSGNGGATNNGTYPSGSLQWIDERSIAFTPVPMSGGGNGGILKVNRNVYDQIITLSETVTVGANSRITITHRGTRTTEEDKTLVDLGGGQYKIIGIENPMSPGDAWAIGELGTSNRYWRISSITPDVKNNTVTLNGVYWDDDILSPSGLVTIG